MADKQTVEAELDKLLLKSRLNTFGNSTVPLQGWEELHVPTLKAQLSQLLIKERQDAERIMFEWTLSRLIDLKKGISTIADIEEMCYAGLRNSANLENQLGEKS